MVADTSPLVYLFYIDQIDLLPQLLGNVIVPAAVHTELCHPGAPAIVRDWARQPRSWVKVHPVALIADPSLRSLGAGERAALALASELPADLILIDERKGTSVALSKGFEDIGTLGVLSLAARRGLVDLADSFARLKRTNFRYTEKVMDELLDERNDA